MTPTFFAPDSVAQQVDAVLARLAAGEVPGRIERQQVDVKEEPGRRGRDGQVQPGQTRNEQAASYLAGELACLANTAGGGAIILGVADDGVRIGTALDAEWLRHRVYELTSRQLTISAREVMLAGVRLLVLTAPEGLEPIRHAGRLRWRVGANCVEMDATSWHAEFRRRTGADWSAEPSGHPLSSASAVAVEIARRYLRDAAARGDAAAGELAAAPTPDLLRRLNVVTGDDQLTQAGALLFVGTPHVGIDYLRRDVAGADSTARVRDTGPLLEQLAKAEAAAGAANRMVHVPGGFAHGQLHELPPLALREAIVNGAIHRDWLSSQPTTVEHIGSQLTVTSPGGFVGGVTPSNIITHPSAPRYRSLAEAVAALRLAEREGIGVDRMVRDMLALGHAAPEITELDGPYVRVSLVGGAPKAAVLDLLRTLEPATTARDVDTLLLLHRCIRSGWVDVARAAPVLQRSSTETEAAIARLTDARVDGAPVLVAVRGVPPGFPSAHRLSDTVRDRLVAAGLMRMDAAARTATVLDWARARGRVSSTEAADLTKLSVPYAGTLLTGLAEEGSLRAGREQRMGRGFFYVPAD